MLSLSKNTISELKSAVRDARDEAISGFDGVYVRTIDVQLVIGNRDEHSDFEPEDWDGTKRQIKKLMEHYGAPYIEVTGKLGLAASFSDYMAGEPLDPAEYYVVEVGP